MRSCTHTLASLCRGALVLCACIGFGAQAHAQGAPPPQDDAAAPATQSPAQSTPPADAPVEPAGDETIDETSTETEGAAAEASLDVEASTESSDAVVESGAGLFAESMAGADESEAVDGEAQGSSFELGGYVRSDVFVGEDPSSNHAALQAGYGELALQVRGPRATYGSAFAEARLRYGQQLDQRDLFIDLREAYVDLWLGPVDIRLGQQIIVWGRADAFNPTNNLMPMDFRIRSPVEDDRRVGNLGLRAFYNLNPVRIEAVWLPLYVPTEYPPINLGDHLVVVEPDFPSTDLEDGLGGGRVHLELSSFEASVSYVNGHAPMPGIEWIGYSVGDPPLNPDGSDLGDDPPGVRIRRTAYRQHVVGADFSTAVSDLFAVRAETAYRRPMRDKRVYPLVGDDVEFVIGAARPDLQYVVGLDRAFGEVTVIVQYVGRYTFDWKREAPAMTSFGNRFDPAILMNMTPPLGSLSEGGIEQALSEEAAYSNQILFAQTEKVQHAVTIRPEWLTLHDTLSLSTLAMFNFSTEEILIFPKVEYRLSDSLRATVGAEIFVAPEDTLFGLVDDQLTAGYAELRYSF